MTDAKPKPLTKEGEAQIRERNAHLLQVSPLSITSWGVPEMAALLATLDAERTASLEARLLESYTERDAARAEAKRLREAARAVMEERKHVGLDRLGRRTTEWVGLTPALIALGNALWPRTPPEPLTDAEQNWAETVARAALKGSGT